MANYYASCRSNYFRVEDIEAFKALMEEHECKVLFRPDPEDPGKELVGFYVDDMDSGALPNYDNENEEEIDLIDEISRHLQENEVCVVQEVGAEKMRYLNGYSIAVNAAGEKLGVDIWDVYALVKTEWGVEPTPCHD